MLVIRLVGSRCPGLEWTGAQNQRRSHSPLPQADSITEIKRCRLTSPYASLAPYRLT
jgi:hypothetical protein